MAIVDALGCLVRFVILPGQAHDLVGVPELVDDLRYGALIGDKAFDADWLIEAIEESGAMAVIPPRCHRTVPREHDREMYRWRHQIENVFARIKHPCLFARGFLKLSRACSNPYTAYTVFLHSPPTSPDAPFHPAATGSGRLRFMSAAPASGCPQAGARSDQVRRSRSSALAVTMSLRITATSATLWCLP